MAYVYGLSHKTTIYINEFLFRGVKCTSCLVFPILQLLEGEETNFDFQTQW